MRPLAQPSSLCTCVCVSEEKGCVCMGCVGCVSQWQPCIVFHPPPQREETYKQHDGRHPSVCVFLHMCHTATPTATQPTRADSLVMTHHHPTSSSTPLQLPLPPPRVFSPFSVPQFPPFISIPPLHPFIHASPLILFPSPPPCFFLCPILSLPLLFLPSLNLNHLFPSIYSHPVSSTVSSLLI